MVSEPSKSSPATLVKRYLLAMKTPDSPFQSGTPVLREEPATTLHPDGRVGCAPHDKPQAERNANDKSETDFRARGHTSLAAARAGEPLITADQVIQEMRDRLARAQQTLR